MATAGECGTPSPSIDAGKLFRVDDLVAVVTGGGTGIGLMMAKALAANGAAKVYIAGRRLEVLQKAAEHIGTGNVVPLTCDVTSKTSLEAAVATVEREMGYLNLLVCNSGIGGPQVKSPEPGENASAWAAKHLAHDMEAYVDAFRVNTMAVWYTTMSFLGLLDAGNKQGNVLQQSQVVVTTSIAAYNRIAPGGWAYGQSKTAATLLVKQLSIALPQWNIRANAICPGLYPSEMSAPIVKLYGESAEGVPKTAVPMGRMGDEQDVAGVMLYLASRAGAYCNSAIIVTDGGRLGNFPSAY